MAALDADELLYAYLDRFRDLLGPDGVQGALLDLSKNDAFALLHLYRAGEVRMSDLADYLRCPLNTTTGVVSRLIRRGYVERHHSPDDKRVVVVALTDAGRALASDGLATLSRYAQPLIADLTPDELTLLLGVVDRALGLLRADRAQPAPTKPAARRIPID